METNFYLETKPDYHRCVDRIEAWFQGEILDRVPIRFHRHNAEYDVTHKSSHATIKDRWFDAEEAQSYGLIDHVVRSAGQVSGSGGTA